MGTGRVYAMRGPFRWLRSAAGTPSELLAQLRREKQQSFVYYSESLPGLGGQGEELPS